MQIYCCSEGFAGSPKYLLLPWNLLISFHLLRMIPLAPRHGEEGYASSQEEEPEGIDNNR